MDNELREMEEMSKKAVSMYSMTFRLAGDISSTSWKLIQPQGRKLRNYIRSKREKSKKAHNEFSDSASKEKIQDIISKSSDSVLTNFKFTGQDTDLCYFIQSDTMPVSAIANITDEKVKESVGECFDKFVKDGFLEMKNGSLHITSAGKQYIQNDFFVRQAKANQMQAYHKQFIQSLKDNHANCAELTGDYQRDFTFFNHSNQLNLSEIASNPNREVSQKILENVKKWQDKGAVTVKDGIATVTFNGKAMLNMPEFQNAIKAIAEKSAEAVRLTTRTVAVTTKKAVQTTAEVTAKTAKATAKATAETAKTAAKIFIR